MRHLRFFALAALTLAIPFAGSFASAQVQEDDARPPRVFGYQDTRTGVFHPLPPASLQASSEQGTTSRVNGTYRIRISTKLLTPLATGEQLVCGATIDVNSLEGPDILIEQKVTGTEAVAAIGKSAVCTITLPFAWVLPSAQINYLANGTWFVEIVNRAAYPIVRRSYTGETGGMAFPSPGETITYNAGHSL